MTSAWAAGAALAALLCIGTAAAATPRFEPTRCGFWVPPQERASCGFLVVPERRDGRRGRTLRLFVAIFHSRSSHPADDPIIYLNGGPGDAAFADDSAERWWEETAPFRRRRDFIVFDQRGVGRSEPSLACREMVELAERPLHPPPSHPEALALDFEAGLACRDRLRAEGIDLTAYTTRESAADVADLATALGVRAYNLIGISYGTRLALAVMRHHPRRVRSVVLDSVYPPGVDDFADRPRLAARVFRLLFADCAADPDCAAAFPRLETRFLDLVRRADRSPLLVAGPAGDGEPQPVDGVTIIDTLYAGFYDRRTISNVPSIIAAAAQGDPVRLGEMVGSRFLGDPFTAEGMTFSVECSETLPFNDWQMLQAQIATYAPYGAGAPYAVEWALCPNWGARPVAETERRPVVSDIPTLLLAGSYDPVTPPEWAYRAAATLSRGTVLEIRDAGHALLTSVPCTESAAVAFLDDPEEDVAALCPWKDEPPHFLGK